jgi:hypothetical protein
VKQFGDENNIKSQKQSQPKQKQKNYKQNFLGSYFGI